MSFIKNGTVYAGIGIGYFVLGAIKEAIISLISDEYIEYKQENGLSIIDIENARFWFNEEERLIKICVWDGFEGTYENKVSIGTCLGDVIETVGLYEGEENQFFVERDDGVFFELEDSNNENKLSSKIKKIYVYRLY